MIFYLMSNVMPEYEPKRITILSKIIQYHQYQQIVGFSSIL